MRAYTASPQNQRKPEEDGDEEELNQYPERRARGEARILAANVCYIVQGDFFGAYIIGSIRRRLFFIAFFCVSLRAMKTYE